MASLQTVKDNYENIEYFNPSLFAQLIRVSKIALWVGLLGLAIVTLLIMLILPAIPAGYSDFIQYMARVQHDLPIMLALSALLLISGAGFTIWFICLYSTFRIAGPLYRFARNLDVQIAEGPSPILKIRQQDRLQGECQLFNQTTESLMAFYRQLQQANEQMQKQLEKAMELNHAVDVKKFKAYTKNMFKLLARTRLNSQSSQTQS